MTHKVYYFNFLEEIFMKMWKKAAEMGGGVSEELNDKIQSGKLSD